MLVLTRKTQEQIHIGDNITISILKLKGNTVRIGIEAPRDVRVLRGELPTFDGTFEGIVDENGDSEADTSKSAASNRAPASSESEQSEEESAASESEWETLKRIAGRRNPCLSVRRCAPKQHAAAPLAAIMRGTSVATTSASVSE